MIVKYNKPGVLNLCGIILLGGANNIPAEQFKPYAKHPTILALVEEGILEFNLYGDDKKSEDKLDAEHLMTLKAKEALELVDATVNQDVLKVWLKAEKRATVKAKLELQLKKLAEPTEFRDGDKKDTSGATPINASGAREELSPLDGND